MDVNGAKCLRGGGDVFFKVPGYEAIIKAVTGWACNTSVSVRVAWDDAALSSSHILSWTLSLAAKMCSTFLSNYTRVRIPPTRMLCLECSANHGTVWILYFFLSFFRQLLGLLEYLVKSFWQTLASLKFTNDKPVFVP